MVYNIDLDGTLIKSELDERGNYKNCRPMRERIKKVNALYERGHLIIIHTGRHWNHLLNTYKQLHKCKIKYHSLVMGKPVADIIVDDKAINDKDFFKSEVKK
jgi:hydroxymethylpyrimidine pyrophosphatase-like HAD family hydrolase